MRRILVAACVAGILAGSLYQKLARDTSLPTLHASQILPAYFWERAKVRRQSVPTEEAFKPIKLLRVPGVYPYSVVPGGVRSITELRYAALHDYVIRHHYAHFNFENARLVRLTEERQVYLSYRIRNTVYWTRKRIRLHVGELLLTDGTITARARCGNQVSDTAKPEVSDEEPDEDVLDQPVAVADATPVIPIRPTLGAPDLPAGEPIAPKLFGGGFFFPYIPVGLPIPSGHCPASELDYHGHCVPKRPKAPVVPEPSTNLLIISGLALVGWRYRKSIRPVAE